MTSLSKEEFFCQVAIIILNMVLEERTEPKTTSQQALSFINKH
jgi:hypothetical protein